VGEQLISIRLKTTGGARFNPLGLRRIMFNFEEVQHAVVNPAWDKKAGKFRFYRLKKIVTQAPEEGKSW
jgi:hypothetical protein